MPGARALSRGWKIRAPAYDMSTAYACTKAAIETLTRYVATQYGQYGVKLRMQRSAAQRGSDQLEAPRTLIAKMSVSPGRIPALG